MISARPKMAYTRSSSASYWISSEQFIELYGQGLLDDGDHLDDFAEWAGYYRLHQKRQAALKQISTQRLA